MTSPSGFLRAAGLVVGGGLVGALLAIVLTEGAGWRTPAPARAGDASRDAGTAEAMRALTTEIAALRAALATAVVPASGAPVPVPREARDAAERLEPLVRRMEEAIARVPLGSSTQGVTAPKAEGTTPEQRQHVGKLHDEITEGNRGSFLASQAARRPHLLQTYAQILARYGRPDMSSVHGSAIQWTYLSDPTNPDRQLLFRFVDGIVCEVDAW